MEVGDKRVHALELVSRIDKDVRIPFLRADEALIVGNRFQGAHACRAYANHSPAFFLGSVDFFGVFFVDFVIFGVHLVIENVFFFHGTESAETYMQKHRRKLDAVVFEPLYQFGGEMQSRGGSGGRAFDFAVHRLIAFLIREFFLDVRRKRHIAHPVENVFEHSVEHKLDRPCAVVADLRHDGGKLVAKMNYGTEFCLARGFHYSFPMRIVLALQKQNFEHAFVIFDVTENARGYDSRVVDDNQIALFEKGRQIVKMFVLHRVLRAVVNEKS